MDISDKLSNLKDQLLDLAIRGKLVEQRPEDGTADELYAQIQEEKKKLIAEGKIKKEKSLPEITEDEIPFEIPESWKWARIGQIYTLQAGTNIKADLIQDTPSEKCQYKCYGGNGIRGYVSNYNHNGNFPIIGRQGALCGNIKHASGYFYATEHAVCVSTFSNTSVKLTCFFLKVLNLNQYSTSTAQPGLSVEKINKVLVPLPPLAEQKRIVEKLESYLAVIDKAEALIDKKANLDEEIRNKILDLAIRGKLVEQRPEEGTAEELYAQIQEEKKKLIAEGKIKKEKPLPEIKDEEIPFDIPESWKWIRVGNFTTVISATRVMKSDWRTEGIPFFRAREIVVLSNKGTVNNDLFISEALFNSFPNESKPAPGDLLVSAVGTLGKCYIVKEEDKFYYKDASVICFKHSRIINPQFLFYLFKSPYLINDIYSKSSGTTVDTLTIKTAEKLLLPLPPLAEQKRIVAKIEELLPYCEKLK